MTVDPEFVRQEYFHLQSTVEDFDQRALTIKAWSVTVSMAGVGAAFTEKQPAILLLSAGSAMQFWIIKILWKKFQVSYYLRIRAMERYMRDGTPGDFNSPEISNQWTVGFRTTYPITWIAWWPHVCLPHVVVGIVGPICWVLNRSLNFISP